MTAFNKKSKPRLDICQILRFHVLNLAIYVYFWIKNLADLDSCIWVPGSGSRHPGPGLRAPDPGSRTPGPESRVPDSRIHLSILGRNQGLKNYTDLFRPWTFFRSDLIDVNSFGMSCTFLACLYTDVFLKYVLLKKKNNYMKTQVIDDGKNILHVLAWIMICILSPGTCLLYAWHSGATTLTCFFYLMFSCYAFFYGASLLSLVFQMRLLEVFIKCSM